MSRRLSLAALVVLLAGCGGGHRSAVRFQVTPANALLDVPFTATASGLPPSRRLTLVATGRSSTGATWRSTRTLTSTRAGTADLADAYLLKKMAPHGTTSAAFFRTWPRTVDVTLRGKGVDVHAAARRNPADFRLVREVDERPAQRGFYGDWFVACRGGSSTAILLLGGSEGGLSQDYLAADLALRGYRVLDLAYFAEPGLPANLSRIPLEYFQRALRWLAAQPGVDPRRVVTFGVSRGGELSLLLASTFPQLVHGAVGYVPSAFAVRSPSNPGPAWTYRGKAVLGLIPVTRISGPVFVAGGWADALWASGSSVQQIAQELHGRRGLVALDYAGAGHLLGLIVPRQIVAPPSDSYGVFESREGTVNLGGSAVADEAAREDSWPKLLRFLAGIGES